jgi:lysophospholipase L1-like esterase
MIPRLRSLCLFTCFPLAALAQAGAPEAAAAPAAVDTVARSSWRIDLYGAREPGFVSVMPTDAYDPDKGYGYDLGTNAATGGAFFFSLAVPEGNYRVTVTFDGSPTPAREVTVKAEARRLMLEHLALDAGEPVSRSFIVNVRNSRLPPPERNAPGGTAVVLNDREHDSLDWDDKLTLEFDLAAPVQSGNTPDANAGTGAGTPAGGRLVVRSITVEPAGVPTVFLAGDSTVTDQRWEPGASWGQMLPRFFGPGVAVANHAESGETLKSFLTGLRLAKVLSQLKAGDYLFIQFGHNDQKQQWPQTYVEAHTTYEAYLRVYVAEARLRGATPVLVASPQRRTFDSAGRIKNTHGDYPAAVQAVATELNVPLIDLGKMSAAFYEALGPERAPLAFSNDGRDITHHNNYGAYELAKCVVQGIRDARLPLAQFIATDFTGFDPAHPDAPESFHFSASPFYSNIAPRGN